MLQEIQQDLKNIIRDIERTGNIQTFIVIEMVNNILKKITPVEEKVEEPIIETQTETIVDTEDKTIEELREEYKNMFWKKPFAWWSKEVLEEKINI